ncbi:MAG: DUF1553 domain-containing protein [Planctomycetaceae bacterium]
MKSLPLKLILLLAAIGPGNQVTAQDVDYRTQVKPILEARCYACHGRLKQEGGLRLETGELILAGGDSGPAIADRNPAASLLVQRVSSPDDSRMPPPADGSALKADEIEILSRWIQQGAVAPDEPVPGSPLEHWAFQPLSIPESIVNPSEKVTGSNNLIDNYFAKVHQQHQLKVQPPAERSLRIRRLYLDLTGLPPDQQQLHDERPWADIVDELLASEQHGERWARHWMDIWRYSDWYGLGDQLRNSQKHLWHWRDWIVESLNADKGYDRMILEMLAGDELVPDDADVIRATGFLARNYYLFNRTTWLDSTIEHTGKAFLGLTLNCAKCHDHKYDPISQVDYYRFRALFEPHQVRLDPVPGSSDLEADGLPRVFDDQPDATTFLHIKGDDKRPDPDTEIRPGVPEVLSGFMDEIQPIDLPITAYAPALREFVRADQLRALDERIAAAVRDRDSAAAALKATPARQPQADQDTSDSSPFLLSDDFDSERPDVWELVGEGWEYADGTLKQTTSTRDSAFLQLKQTLPEDFEITCRYSHTGGATYQSVTFRFDEAPDRGFASFVYTSAHAPDPKLQVAFTRDGKTSYPGNGRVSQPIQAGGTYTLKFAVRGLLMNVWLDDQLVLAWQLSERRPQGRFSLSAFDGTAAFDFISIRSLPKDLVLKPASNAEPAPTDPESQLQLAERKLQAAELARQSLLATLEADRALIEAPDADRTRQLSLSAARLQAELRIADAEVSRLSAAGAADKLKAAEQKIQEAQQTLQKIASGEGQHAAVRVSRKALETPEHKEPNYPTVYSSTSTGRRLALARWITSPKNPLTARVAVNHVWTRHFGEPLVESVADFGLRTTEPVHRELLDRLAVELMTSGWSLKHLHRLIVTSDAWQRTSSEQHADSATRAADPANALYWRMNTRRMEAQLIRDSLLSLSGKLDTTMGGPSVDANGESRRRSLYFKHSRDDRNSFLSMFDDADLLQCYRRSESIVPQQALALSNSRLALIAAADLADRLDAGNPEIPQKDFVTRAFETILARLPDEEEHQACVEFCHELTEATDPLVSPEIAQIRRTRIGLIHALLNHNDFISIR